MRKFYADKIFTGYSAPLEKQIVVTDDLGKILAIQPYDDAAENVEKLQGWLCPGFVNTHCHLELSYLKGKIHSKTGLHAFIKEIETLKQPLTEDIHQAIELADAELYHNGVVATGDISNTDHSFSVKKRSAIYYHTFLEVYAFDPSRAETAFNKGEQLLNTTERLGLKASISPHAPYSASEALLQKIAARATANKSPVTIHNQESADEDLFFLNKTGSIAKRLEYFGIDISGWQAPGTSSLRHTLPQLPKNKTLLVHNTFTTAHDIKWAQQYNPEVYWAFCPKANLYIEDRLPNVPLFLAQQDHLTVGTDSLASNNSLSVLDELKVLQHHFPELSTQQLIQWATWNGANFLGISHTFGSIEAGKTPGLILLQGMEKECLSASVTAQRII